MLPRLASRRVNGAWVRHATTSAPRDTTGLDYKKRFGKEDYVDNEIRAKTYVRTGQAASIVCSRRIQNLAEAMSLIRAVEERVGPVLQFEFQKDYISRACTWRADIVFKNSESRSLIKHGVSFTLPPGPLAARPEGSGLAELGAFLQPRQHNPELELKPLENVSADPKERQAWTPLDQPWTITITPAKNPLNIQKRISHYPRQRVHNIAKWGGFTHLDALPDHIPLTPDVPQAMMRYALERWSRYGNEDYTPKPAIIAEHPEQPVQAAPKQDSKTSPQLVSEPVVETSTETTDVQEAETVQQSEPEPEPVRVKRGPPPRPTPAARRVQKPMQAAEADDAAQRAAIQQANALKAALAKGRRAAKPVVERKKVEVRQTKRVEHKPAAPEQPVEATVTEKAAEAREESGEANNDVVGKLKKSIFGSWL